MDPKILEGLIHTIEDIEYPCIPLETLWEYWEKAYIPIIGRKLEEMDPRFRRYRRYIAHRLDWFERAVRTWINHGLRKSHIHDWGIRDAIREEFGYFHPFFYYYMRWLGMYLESMDSELLFREKWEGFLFNPIKLVLTGSYTKKYRKTYRKGRKKSRGPVRPWEFQVEIVVTAPCMEYQEERGLCIDVHWLKELFENLMDALQEGEWRRVAKAFRGKKKPEEKWRIIEEVEEEARGKWYSLLYGLNPPYIETIKDNAKVEAVEVDFGAAAWGFERMFYAEFGLVAIQSVHLRSYMPEYEYFAYFIRTHWPSSDVDLVLPVTTRPEPTGPVRFSYIYIAMSHEWVEKQAEEAIPRLREKLERKAERYAEEWGPLALIGE
ncbi:MAG: hypothetical protein DRP00_04890 [Candidatus Aenigmatarchaeota archaeon]|nr:MAG: hypothetical protein DRP00_04890 [Candidatus Aenigmarchaeota archaeon]